MKPSMAELQRIVTLSNDLAKNPPTQLKKVEYQALLILVSCIDSMEKPVFSLDDIKQEIDDLGITKPSEQMRYLELFITKQNTFRIPFKEYAKYFSDGRTARGGVAKRALDAALSLNNRDLSFNNTESEGSFKWFQAVYRDKKTDELVFVITSLIKPFLMGLQKDFLQMLAASTMDFDGKHSIPIFLYMKSKLYAGNDEMRGKENVLEFRKRFGLDKIRTYDRFYELERRVLKVAAEDSKKSGDIAFIFEGRATKTGTKKITEIHYHIFRIGGALADAKRSLFGSGNHKEKLGKLTRSQKLAYDYLVEKEVNKAFIVDKMFSHPKMQYEPLTGYEDIYFDLVWKFFLKKTKSRNKAGAFVTWWKRGRLTEDSLHAKMIEAVQHKKKTLPHGVMENRESAKSMTVAEFREFIRGRKSNQKLNTDLGITPPDKQIARLGRRPFSFHDFKREYTDAYQKIAKERKAAFMKDYKSYEKDSKLQKMLEDSIATHCEQWHLKQS
ncbi:MAG: hypothetical protein ACI94Y_001932 [Maribacter sp.]|jgi:hypothetical protein